MTEEQAVSKWESGQSIPDVDKIMAIGEYFCVTTDYLLKGTESIVESEADGVKPFVENEVRSESGKLPLIATGLNALGFLVLFFDAMLSWHITPYAMSQGMIVQKIIGVALLILGTTVFYCGLDKKKNYVRFRKFIMVNVWFYAIVASLIVYFIDLPHFWAFAAYVCAVFGVGLFLRKKDRSR